MFQAAFPSLSLVSLNVLGIGGIVAWYLIAEERANTRLAVQIAFFLTMTIVLAASGIAPSGFDAAIVWHARGLLALAARLLWWLHLAWALIGFVRIALVLEGKPREARLLQDLLVGIVYLGVAGSALAFVFGAPVGTLIATSGVVAVFLGLALQNTLGDVFSGIALSIGRSHALGDWILLGDGTEGRVVETDWRSTQLLTGAGNIVVLPNGVLAKLALTNLSRPNEAHLQKIKLRFAATHPPSEVLEITSSALRACDAIVQNPPPVVALNDLDATAVEVELLFLVASPSQRIPARNAVVRLVYERAKAVGLEFAMPKASFVTILDDPTMGTDRRSI